MIVYSDPSICMGQHSFPDQQSKKEIKSQHSRKLAGRVPLSDGVMLRPLSHHIIAASADFLTETDSLSCTGEQSRKRFTSSLANFSEAFADSKNLSQKQKRKTTTTAAATELIKLSQISLEENSEYLAPEWGDLG